MKYLSLPLMVVLSLFVAGCGPSKGGGMPPGAMIPEVGVVTVVAAPLTVTTELPGRIDATRMAQVRARATGIVLKQMFKEGADVKEGDELFQIDPASLQANLDNAKAGLAKATAVLKQVQARVDRYKSLVEVSAISKQEYDDATAAVSQAKAEEESAQAAVQTATLNLGYTTVTAPIAGRIGAGKVTEGAYVSQAEATLLAVIQQLDPVYFDFTQSSTEMLKLKRAMDEGKLQSIAPGEAKIALVFEDGSIYPYPGKLIFSDVTVDPTTGMVTLRAEFPNSEHVLLPGMFARGKVDQAVDANAITVPQRGVALGANGSATVMVVGADNKVIAKSVKISSAIKDQWIVTEGLQDGDRVIVEGLQKIRPLAEVKAVPFNPAGDNASPAPAIKGN